MNDVGLRPLRVGEILDVAIKLYRTNFSTLVKAVFVVVAPTQVLSALITSSSRSAEIGGLGGFGGAGFDPNTTQQIDTGDLRNFLVATALVGAIGIVTAQLASAASLRALSGAYLGEPVDWKSSLGFAYHRLGSLVWLGILHALVLGLGFLLCIAPGVYLYGALSVAVPVLLMEDKRGRKALGRSRELVRGRWWPVAGVLLVSAVLAAIIQGALTGLVVGVAFSSSNELASDIIGTIAAIGAALITTPFAAAVIIVLYIDLRVRKEGFDLELLARGIGADPATPAVRPAFLPAGAPDRIAEGDEDDQPPFWPPPPGWQPRSRP